MVPDLIDAVNARLSQLTVRQTGLEGSVGMAS